MPPAAGRATPSARTPISASPSSSRAGSRITPTAATATGSCPTPSRPTRSSATAGPMAACRSCSKHWRRFLPGASLLTREQKREFAIGWLNWLGAESIGVAVAILNLAWVPVVAFVGIAIPDKVLTIPIMAAFAVSVAHFLALYRRRVSISPGQTAAAMLAAMSMQWTVARAVVTGLVIEHLPFVRTAKRRQVAKAASRFPGLLRGGDGRPPDPRRRRSVPAELRGRARDQPVRRRADGAEPAVPRRRGARRDRGDAPSTTSRSEGRSRHAPFAPSASLPAAPPSGSRPAGRADRQPSARTKRSQSRSGEIAANWRLSQRLRAVTPASRSRPAAPSTTCRPGSPRR